MKLWPGLLILLALCAGAHAAEPWAAPEEARADFQRLCGFFENAEVRLPGSPGNLAIEQKVARLFEASGFKNGKMSFRAPALVPGETTLSLEGRAAVRLLPLYPTLLRPGNFPEAHFTAPLVYLGRGTIEDLARLKGVNLDGALALMEFDCGANWARMLRFGIRGFIFIGEKDYERSDAESKVYSSEAAVPRFFVTAETGAALRQTAQTTMPPLAKIDAAPTRWEAATLHNFWVFIPGQDPDVSQEVCVVTAPMDSNCVVPELAEGAQAGANLFTLLRLLESFSRQPPARSVLLAAVNAHTQNYLGEDVLAWHLLAGDRASHDVEELRNLMAQDIRVQEAYRDQYQRLNDLLADPQKHAAAEQLLLDLRTKVDDSTGRGLTLKKELVSLIKSDLTRAKLDQLARYRELKGKGLPEEQIQSQLKARKASQEGLVSILILFNKWGNSKVLSDLKPDEVALLRQYVAQALATKIRHADLSRRDLTADQENGAVRLALEGRSVRWVTSLEMTWRGKHVGFGSAEPWNNAAWRSGWGAEMVKTAEKLAADRENLLLDTMTFKGGQPEGYYFPVADVAQVFQAAQQTPAFSLQTAFTGNGRAFLPSDTFSSLDPQATGELLAYAPQLLRAMLATPIDSRMLQPKQVRRLSYTIQIRAFRCDPFAASVVPDLPVPNTFVALRSPFSAPLSGDVVNSYMYLTDERAVATFYGIRECWPLQSGAFHFDPDFNRIDFAIDAGEKERSLSSNVIKQASQTIVLFPCKELPIYARENPALLSQPLGVDNYGVLDARRESAPRQFGLSGAGSKGYSAKSIEYVPAPFPATIFSETQQRLKLLTARAHVLGSTPENPEGDGIGGIEDVGPDFFLTSAKDMLALNRYRLGRLRGVSQELAREFLDRGDEALRSAEKARSENDHVRYLQALDTAVGAQYQAYAQISGITNDMLSAVIFYMALILPFCFFLQKLLFNLVRVEAQIACFFGLFIGCYLLFRQIHPAFEIAKSPEGILIAFVMGCLGAFVIKILHGRFEGEMQTLFRNFSGNAAASVGYSTVGQKAMLIGVNNMRRRRVRTLLTTATIVLVTFTMLSFSSISQKMSPTIVAVSAGQPPYTGLMYHWPGRCMDEATVNLLRELFFDKAEVVTRRWLLPTQLEKTIIPLRAVANSGKEVKIEGILGLPAADNGFLAPMPLLAGRFYSADNSDEVVVPAALAEMLGLTAANLKDASLRLAGRAFKITGILNDDQFRQLTDLDGQELRPLKQGLITSDQTVPSGAMDATQSKVQAGFFVDTSALLLMPVETAAKLGAQPYSVSVRFKAGAPGVWPATLQLLNIAQANVYLGSQKPFVAGDETASASADNRGQELKAGVYYIGAGFRPSFGNFASLIVPLLISGTIILNTMLGSVFERKKEIAVYNAVGLNPNHIGMFFLSEALVYSIIGSVGGYLIGQFGSIAIQHLGVQGIDVNFSSLKVVYVILFTVAMVMLSTLYPAIVATRAAVPSGKRKWAFPAHDGQRMEVVFPFIYRPEIAPGVITYLEDYFGRFSEASVGDLIATRTGRQRGKDAAGRDTYMLEYNLALAPFDLGVTQRVSFIFSYNERVQSYGITMVNVRVSGQDTNWVTTNKPFLERLRAHLMHWRSLDSAQQTLYAQAALQAFEFNTTVSTVLAASRA